MSYPRTSWTIKDPVRACTLARILIVQEYEFGIEYQPEGVIVWIRIDDDFDVHMKRVDKIQQIVDVINRRLHD